METDELSQDETGGVPTIEDCAFALGHVYSFLHDEVDDDMADEIRRHLMTCGRCLDTYDVESLITVLVKRSYAVTPASVSLRERVSCLHIACDC